MKRNCPGSRNRFCIDRSHLLLTVSLIVCAFSIGFSVHTGRFAWFAWVGMIPLFLAIKRLSPLCAMVAGGLWGLGIVLATLTTGTPTGTVYALSLIPAVSAVYAYLGALVSERFGFAPFLFAFGWIGVEYALRPLGLTGGLLSSAQNSAFSATIGGLLGYGFMAFLIALTNVAIVSIVEQTQIRVPRWTTTVFQLGVYGHCVPAQSSHTSHCEILLTNPRAPPLAAGIIQRFRFSITTFKSINKFL